MNNVLIVDDQSDVRLRAAELLRASGLLPRDIYEAATVADAVEMACAHRPALILLDVVLPDGTGFDVLNQLREKGMDPQAIMMTAFPQFDYALQAINSQVRGFLVKPLDENEFNRLISSFQGTEQMHRQHHLAYTMLDVYLKGQQFSMQLEEMRQATGINRLRGSHYLVMVVSLANAVNLENQIINFRKILNKESIDSVHYLQNTNTLVEIMRDDDPVRLLPVLENGLKKAFIDYFAGCACPHADIGIRAAYQNAVFAMQYAVETQEKQNLICYEMLNLARILVQRQKERLLARETESIEALMLEFSRNEIKIEDAKQALMEFCQEAQIEVGDAFSVCDHFRQMDTAFRNLLTIETDDIKRKNSSQLARVKEYIDLHWQENINRTTIAEALGISYSYVGELFRTELKQGVTEYIQSIRMKHAEELLKNTRLSINRIAEQIGYQDSGSFIRVFIKHYQITPGEWRLQQKDDNQ